MPIKEHVFGHTRRGLVWNLLDEATRIKLTRLEQLRAKALIVFWERWYRQHWQSVSYGELEGLHRRLMTLYQNSGRNTAELRRQYLLDRAERLAREHVTGEKKGWSKHTDTLRHIDTFLFREGIEPQVVGGAVRALRQKIARQSRARKYRGPKRKAWWVYSARGFGRALVAPRTSPPSGYYATRAAAKANYLEELGITEKELIRRISYLRR